MTGADSERNRDHESTDCYRIDSDATRRSFLRAVAVAGTGVSGLRAATERTFGAEPDGVPIVWRRDRFGAPETIRYVEKERYRRLSVYHDIEPGYFADRAASVNGITISQRSADSSDLGLTFYVDRNTWAVRRALPNRIRGVPVTVEERKTDWQFGRVCRRRILDFYDPLPANVQISGVDSDGTAGVGTLGLVCWNDDPDDPYRCYITAAHVVEYDDGRPATYLHHGGEDADGNQRSERVGVYETHDSQDHSGMDVAKYRQNSESPTPGMRANASDELPDVDGTWTHAGLTDRTAGERRLRAKFAGRSTCYGETYCIGTSKSGVVEFQADYAPNVVTNGDSGGPFLDADGYLIGTYTSSCEECETTSGPTGQELLDRVGAQLHSPQLVRPHDPRTHP